MSQIPVKEIEVGPRILAPGRWEIDSDRSSVAFVVRQLMSRVRGRFTSFAGTMTVDPDPSRSWVEVTIEAASIDTGNDQRDTHLRSPAFLDAERFPQLSFRSASITPLQSDGGFRVEGDVTIRDVTRSVVLDARYLGSSGNSQETPRAAFLAGTELRRDLFGVVWNSWIEGGGVVIGKHVQVELEIVAIRRADSA
jgi:polyisoprenoid-binding protein YceI